MDALKVKNLTKHFDGVKAVHHLSLHIKRGGVTGLVGPNGSGKTTLVNLLSGMVPFDEGTIVLNGSRAMREVIPSHISLYGVTRTFQDVRLFEQITVLDNILVALTERTVMAALFERHTVYHTGQAEDALRRVNLWSKRNELAANLSYGQRKLLEIARALATDAAVYLFDEPFAGLFPEMVEIVSDTINVLRKQGKTIVLIEHNMDLIRRLCDHIIVMEQGALLTEGTPEAALSEKKVVEAYLGQ